jgi:hypothetical protein
MADGESTGERLDRELMELLQELRVVLPGVQVLLAFLLVAPFQPRFAQLPGSLRNAFFASVACATVATALLIAPRPTTGCAGGPATKSACCGLVTSWPCGARCSWPRRSCWPCMSSPTSCT